MGTGCLAQGLRDKFHISVSEPFPKAGVNTKVRHSGRRV